MKAIVIDIVNNEAALLKEDGSILKVANHGFQIGQEVVLEYACDKEKTTSDSGKTVKKQLPLHTRHISRGLIAAAIAATLLFTIGICAYAMPYGTVTDEDSSIEYTINVFDRVIDVNATDEHGETLLADVENHKNQKIGDVLKKTCKAGANINVETGSEHHDKKLTEELNQIIDNTFPESLEDVTAIETNNTEMTDNGEADHNEPDHQYEAPPVHESMDTMDSKPLNNTEQTPVDNVPESNREDEPDHPSDDITHKSELEMSVPQEPASKEKNDPSENIETDASGSAPESALESAPAPAPEVPDNRPEIHELSEPPKEGKSESIPVDGDRHVPAEQKH